MLKSATAETSAWTRWERRVETVLFLEAMVPNVVLVAIGDAVHLGDTYFTIGAFHLEALVLVVALTRGKGVRHIAEWIGLALAAVGAQVFGVALLQLGRRGMPRRYWEYLEAFQPLHVVAGCGACLVLLGLSMIFVTRIPRHRSIPVRLDT